jgi:hypothetical protein
MLRSQVPANAPAAFPEALEAFGRTRPAPWGAAKLAKIRFFW